MEHEPVKLNWLGWFVGLAVALSVITHFWVSQIEWLSPAIYAGATAVLLALLYIPSTKIVAKAKIWLLMLLFWVYFVLSFIDEVRAHRLGAVFMGAGCLISSIGVFVLYRYRTTPSNSSTKEGEIANG